MPTTQFVTSVSANLAYWHDHSGLVNPRAWALLDRERQNLFRAVSFGLQVEETFVEAAELAARCYTYVFERGYGAEWIPTLEGSITGCPDGHPSLKGELLHQLGSLQRKDRRLDEAMATHLQEEALGRQTKDQMRIASAQLGLGRVYFRQREHAVAERYAKQALRGFEDLQAAPALMAQVRNLLGIVAQARGELTESEVNLRLASELYRQAGNPVESSRSQVNLCMSLEAMGQVDEALELLDEAAKVFGAYDLQLELARVHQVLGTLHFKRGDLELAEAAFRQADSQPMRRYGPVYFRSLTEMNLGNVLLSQGRYEESQTYFMSSVAGFRLVNAKTFLANSLDGLGEISLALGDRQGSVALYEEALAIVTAIPDDAFARRMEERFRGLLEKMTVADGEEE